MPRAHWEDGLLDEVRQLGDPLADTAVRAIFEQGEIEAVNRLFGALLAGRMPTADAPRSLVAFLDQTSTLPAWADAQKLTVAERLAVDYGFLCAGVLYTSGLPTCYASRGIAAVLASTLRLEKPELMWRRLIETGQFVFNVSNTGGMRANGEGVRATQQVRLMHAAIRHLILTPPAMSNAVGDAPALGRSLLAMEWDPSLGHPINQEELAWTLLTFSYCVLRALEQLGAVLSDEQKDAYVHLWRVVGHVLGVDARLQCADFAEAAALFGRLAPRVAAGTPEGRRLVSALVDFAAPVLAPSLMRALIRYHVGDSLAGFIGARADGAGRLLQSAVVATTRFAVERVTFLYRQSYVVKWLGEQATRRIIARVVSLSRAHGRAPFQLPTSLAVRLGLPAAPGAMTRV
jgi:hypothetical protein